MLVIIFLKKIVIQNCSSHSPAGQLILPEALKYLPIFAQSMMKMDGYKTGINYSFTSFHSSLGSETDRRIAQIAQFDCSLPLTLLLSIYPRAWPLHEIVAVRNFFSSSF